MARHFWDGQIDPEADLDQSLEYLRPLKPGVFAEEVYSSLAPTDPLPPEKEEPLSLLKEHELEPEEFVRQAVEHPEMWDQLDHQYLQDVLEGAEANEDLERLADDWLSGRADERSLLSVGALPDLPPEEDLGGPGEGFDDHVGELGGAPVSLTTIGGLDIEDEEPVDLSKVEKWWEGK